MRYYRVKYKMYSSSEEKYFEVSAKNKAEAYDWATYEVIPSIEGSVPYSSWVDAVLCANGKEHIFNTSEGNPY